MADSTPAPEHKPESDGDYLGYGVYADTLWARIARALDKDANGKTKLGDDPLVVGIFGEWGAGKSKLLSMVLDRAAQQSARDISERVLTATSGRPLTVTVPVFFQPWKYEHERHLHVPLAVHIAEALKDAWKQLPADIEQLRVFAAKAGQSAEEVGQALTQAKDTFDKAKGFLDGALGALKSRAGAVVAGTADVLLTSVGVPPLASLARRKIIDSLDDGSEETEADDEEPAGKTTPGTKPKPIREQQHGDPWGWKDDGLGFYRMHSQLRALTRPKLDKKLLEKAGIEVTPGIEFDLRINFVVFIDDLDRCLPEKAVEALELIKTVFNLESFAFVLALDEEVVERGIGHRYRDYHFEGKKPEMPITGFEYLEKIVHLPFRLPALTRGQAAGFVREYEERTQPDVDLRWFSPAAPDKPGDATKSAPFSVAVDRRGAARGSRPDLLALALDSFDAWVPRKLIRMVELFHQVAAVARARGRPLRWEPASADDARAVDVRVVLALVLVQLFQPELYRLMRRRVQAFPVLLAAFALRPNGQRDLSGIHIADVDLWEWVAPTVEGVPVVRRARLEQAIDDAVERIGKLAMAQAPSRPDAALQMRALAQHVRLPLVVQLVEHRATHRHVFDVLKLMRALALSCEATGSPDPAALTFEPYRTLLAEEKVFGTAGISEQDDQMHSTAEVRATHRVRDVGKLFADLVSDQTEVQANLVASNELPSGHLLDGSSADALLQLTQNASAAAKQRLAIGLQYLAPYLTPTDQKLFWELLEPDLRNGDQEGAPLADTAAVHRRETWMDLRSTLGADPRFDPQSLYLPRERHANNSEQTEPIPGFVRVPKGFFPRGSQEDADNPAANVEIKNDFFIARYLTTVAQYAAFVDDGGYTNDAWWDSQGIAWRMMQWASGTNNKDLRQWLDSRSEAERQQPRDWGGQLAHGSRPVHGVNWFEARAYARWLTGKLAALYEDLFRTVLSGYGVRLPVESQWERAARAAANGTAHSHRWPWGDDEESAPWRANIDAAKIGRASVVGLFDPNPLGIADLAGNLWEWQDNLYAYNGPYKSWARLPRITGAASGNTEPPGWLATAEEWKDSALPSLRGGSWGNGADNARASIRHWFLPDGAYHDVGFRVVLSLADLASET